MAGADEGDFIELLVANERVIDWLERIRAKGPLAKQKTAVMQLKAAVESKPTYAEEARQAGVVQIMTGVLATTDDEEILDAVSCIIAACSGHLACGGKVTEHVYDGTLVRIKEGMLGDGLGAKVWLVAHILCRELTAHPEIVRGQQVLEVGAGCGVCGITAALLGAQHVVLSDIVPAVLRNLRDCMHLNAASSSQPAGASAQQPDSQPVPSTSTRASKENNQTTKAMPAVSDAELFDDAEEVDDFDFAVLLGNGGDEQSKQQNGVGAGSSASSNGAWEVDNMSVRLLDWAESVVALDGAPPRGIVAGTHGGELDPQGADMPSCVEPGAKWPVIIGSEVIYEPVHAQMLAAVIRHRLAPGGACILNCAVRELRVFELFARECAARGLRYRRHQVSPAEEYEGILGKDSDYEGGFLLMAIDHADAPHASWHRDDFDVVVQ